MAHQEEWSSDPISIRQIKEQERILATDIVDEKEEEILKVLRSRKRVQQELLEIRLTENSL